MKKIQLSGTRLLAVLVILLTLTACSRMAVGYLRTKGASFAPDTLAVYRTLDPSSDRYRNQLPWVSTRIQGVAGTNPVNYVYAGVTATEGGDSARFEQMVSKGYLKVDGGLVLLFQKGVAEIPNGRYNISLNVFNDDHSALLKNVFTIVVKEQED